MTLKLCLLGSGSSGNCTFIGTGTTRILIDAGLSARKTAERLTEIGERAEEINAICVSHEHGDHIAGIRVLQKNHGIPVYANGGTLDAILRDSKQAGLECRRFTTGAPFAIGDLMIEPFSVPHDAYEPVGFVVRAGALSVGVVTDIGVVTGLVREKLRKCQAVVIEANHDETLLHEAARPWSLKQRIRGNQGHLSNRAAAALIAEIAGDGLQHLFLAHLSADCNSPHHARTAFETLLSGAGHTHVTVRLAGADGVSEQVILEG
ncbi:MAG: MBL fold metallo-hydrolase [Verrucomicrobia bacterium]|nr:MBL fold metallo-hydrolase [Verrucomicrobiota bacterium]